MSLSLKEKQNFYEQLRQLLGAGIPITPALEKLTVMARGSLRAFLKSVRRQIEEGATIAEAFQNARPAVSEMEQATLAGLARSGSMDRGLAQLSAYFGAMHVARRQTIRRLLYPVFLLHLAIILLKAPILVTEGGGLPKYLHAVGTELVVLYGFLIIASVVISFLMDAGAALPSVDQLLRLVPFLGKARRSFAVSRFCATYDMQLESGINVLNSLEAAGRASQSGLIRAAVRQALPELRKGTQVGTLLAPRTVAFPRHMLSAFLVAEDSGQLDRTLGSLTQEYQEDAFRRVDSASEWIPRLIYLAIAGFVGWQVIAAYNGYLQMVNDIGGQLDSLQGR